MTQRRLEDMSREELLEALARYTDLYNYAPIGYLTLNLKGHIEHINLTGASLLGATPEQLTGKSLAAVTSIRDMRTLQDHLLRCASGEARVSSEVSVWTEDRGPLILQVVTIPFRDAEMNVVGHRAVLTDITATKELERKLRFLAEVGESLASSLDQASVAAAVTRAGVPFVGDLCFLDMIDQDGRLQRESVAFSSSVQQSSLAERLRRSRPRPGERSWQEEVIISGEPMLVSDPLLPRRDRGSPASEDIAVLRAARVSSLMIVPLTAHGSTFGALTFGAIRARRRYLQSDLLLAQEIGNRAASALENARLLAHAQRAIRARDSLLAAVSHDLRTPLGVIMLKSASLLRAAYDSDAPVPRSLHAIQRAGERMDRLIRDLLDVTKIDAGQFTIERDAHALEPLVREALEIHSEAAARGALRLIAQLGEGIAGTIVECDRERVHQVLTNLLDNAMKFSRPGGTITVRAERREDDALLSVADTGPGIAEEHLGHVFDRFWQADRTARHSAGLGLTIARGIIESHEGRLWVQSAPGAGATFYFTLPLAPQTARVPTEERLLGGAIPEPARTPAPSELILVVDDDQDTREAMVELLVSEGYTVQCAANGAEALARLRTSPAPLAVLLDLKMPVMDGWAFLAERGRDPALCNIPVIVMSGTPETEGRLTAVNAWHLPKPPRADKLFALLRERAVR